LARSSTKGIARHRKWLMPQEVEVWYVIPSIRRELALTMIEKGRTQKSIAKMLGVTEPAVTQYKLSRGKDSSRSRGDRVDIPEKFQPEIEKSADERSKNIRNNDKRD
jgi:predicted transcriptional regulator